MVKSPARQTKPAVKKSSQLAAKKTSPKKVLKKVVTKLRRLGAGSRAKRTPRKPGIKRPRAVKSPAVTLPLMENAKEAKLPHDLPFSYGKTQLVLLVRDPEWAYAYWDFSASTWGWIQDFYRRDPGLAVKLRVHRLGGDFFDLDVHLEAKNWYVRLGSDNQEFEAELGMVDSRGRFHAIVRSNRVKTPRGRPSDKVDPAWDPRPFEAEIYRLSGGGQTGKGSEVFSQLAKKHT